jgi:amidohydrolase
MPTTTTLSQAKFLQEEIVFMRRHLHANPELSFEEHNTGKMAAERLVQHGYKVRTGIGKTGVLAQLGSGVTVAIRADMDALPIQETNAVEYKSKKTNVMHACGHDAHVSCVLTAAHLLSNEKPLPGRVRILLQPSEETCDSEGKSGARRMIEDGAVDDVAAAIGLHMDASLPAGKVGIIDGAAMAAADCFKLTITGKGGHGAYPETTVDAVAIACQVVTAIQQIVSRRVSALMPAVVTVGSFHSASTRPNVITDQVVLLGTIRSFNPDVRRLLMDELDRTAAISRCLGGDYKLDWELGYPATVNDPFVTEIMRKTAIDLIGEENVIAIAPKLWGEDFSMFAELVPGAFMFLGGEIEGDRRSHHSPNFDIDESGLYLGSAILAETAKRLMIALEK